MTSNKKLYLWVQKSSKSAIYETIFGFVVLGLFGFLMYQKSSGNLLWLLLGICGLLFFVGIYTYGGTIRRGRIINNTVSSIEFNDTTISFQTFSYNILGLKELPLQEIKLERESLGIKDCDYPIMDKKTIKGKALVIRSNQQDFYILPQFFPENLKQYLTK